LLNHTAKMLVWDIETSSIDILHRQYDLTVNTKRFSPDEIVRDWIMLGASWKLIGNDRVHCVSVSSKNPLDDYMVVKSTYEALEQADILIGHNSDAFDLKKFNARAIFYGMPPLPQKQQIDTLKEARKYFKFTSNKLSYLANYLGIESKDESPDWNKILDGDTQELSYMREYNKKDVIVTEQLYFKLASWMRTHPDVSVHTPIKDIEGNIIKSCSNCNSTNLAPSGSRFTKKKAVKRYRCRDCNKYN
jgi:DNA polymerase elongation subunit (family B)